MTDLLANAASIGGSAGSLVTNISLTTAIVIGTIVALFAFALRYGKDRIIALIYALYLGLLVFLYFPYGEKVASWIPVGGPDVLPQAILFMAFVLVAYLAIWKNVWGEYPQGGMRYIQAGVLALAASALLIAFSYAVLPLAKAYAFDLPVSGTLFERPEFFFWWLVAPLIAIFLFGRE